MKCSQAQGIAAVNALVANNGVNPTNDTLNIYSGTAPSTVNANPTGALLSVAQQSGQYSTSSIAGAAVQNSMTPLLGVCYRDSNARATGTAGYFRIVDFSGAAKFQGTVGTTASFELQLNTTAIIAGQIVTITAQQLLVTGLL